MTTANPDWKSTAFCGPMLTMTDKVVKAPRRPRPEWSKRLAEARKARSLSQVALADECSVSQSAIADYESGRSEPSLDMFGRLSGALRTSPQWLIFGVGEMFANYEVDYDLFPTYMATINSDSVFKYIVGQLEEELRKENLFTRDVELLLLMGARIGREFRRERPSADLSHLGEEDLACLQDRLWSERHAIRNGLRRLRMDLISGALPLVTAFRG